MKSGRLFRRIFGGLRATAQRMSQPWLNRGCPPLIGTFELLEDRSLLSGTPQLLDVLDVAPDPRHTAVAAVGVEFSTAIDLATFDYHDLSLERDGNPVPLDSTITVAQVSSGTYAIGGLEKFTTAAGQYQLTVAAADIRDAQGNAATGTASDSWTRTAPPTITQTQLDVIVTAARQTWQDTGLLTGAQLQLLPQLRFLIGTLSGSQLAGSLGNSQVVIDGDGGGQGWFVDPTPQDSSEFPIPQTTHQLLADAVSPAVRYIDLYTTVLDEMGKQLNVPAASSPDLLKGVISRGERLLPASAWDGLNVAVLIQLRTQHGFHFLGSYYDNSHEQQEKWFQDRLGHWFALTSDGKIHQWDDVSFSSSPVLPETVDTAVYANPNLLFQVPVQLTPGLQSQLTQLRISNGFHFLGSYYDNSHGQQEKWFQDRLGHWFALTPDGNLHSWNGVGFVNPPTLLDPLVYDDPNLLFQAPVQLSDALQAQLSQQRAANGFHFLGSYYDNSHGLQEKWFQDRLGHWFALTPDGNLHSWNGVDFVNPPTLLDPLVYDDPNLLLQASLSSPQAPLSFTQAELDRLEQIRSQHGFHFLGSYYENSHHANEKWFQDSLGAWFAITPDGKLHQWNGITLDSSPVIEQLNPLAYDDPSVLFPAQLVTAAIQSQSPQSISVIISGNSASFNGLSSDNLYLLVTGGQLEYSETGAAGTYTNTGLSMNSATSVTVSIGGQLYLAGMDQGGGQFQRQQGAIEISGNMTTLGQDLSVSGTSITVDSGIIVSTRQTATAAQVLSPTTTSTGNSGQLTFTVQNIDFLNPLLNIDFSSPTITISSNAKLLSNVEPGSAFKGGDIGLSATNTNLALDLVGFLTFAALSRNATINVSDGAMLNGANVTLTTNAGDYDPLGKLASGSQGEQWLAGLIGDVLPFINDRLSLPVSVIVKVAHAKIEMNQHSQIVSSGAVTLESTAASEGNGEATYYGTTQLGFSFAFAWAQPRAETLIDPSAVISAAGSVDLSSTASASANVTSRVSQNIAKSSANTTQHIQFAAAVGRDKLTAHTIVAQDAAITAGGNVNVAATGANKNKISAESATYIDGKAGLTFGLELTDTDVLAQVDGHITASGTGSTSQQPLNFNPFTQLLTPTLSFTPAAVSSNAITLASTSNLTSGQAVVYSVAGGNPIRGLTAGQTYYVIVVDATTIQLAATLANAVAATPVAIPLDASVAGGTQSLRTNGVIDFGGTPHGFQTGDRISYSSGLGGPIGGLDNGNTYYVIALSSTRLELAMTRSAALLGQAVTFDANPGLTSAADPNKSTVFTQVDEGAFTFPTSSVSNNQIDLGRQTGFATGQAVVYTASGNPIAGLQNNGTYYVLGVDNQTVQLTDLMAVTAAGAGTASLGTQGDPAPQTFNPSAVSGSTSIITVPNHGFTTGQQVTYTTTGTSIGGLVSGNNYYAIQLSDNTFQLAASQTDALTNRPITLDPAAASGTQAIGNLGTITFTAAAINDSSHTITFAYNHNFTEGQAVTYHASGGTPINGLTDGDTYHVMVVSPTMIQLISSAPLTLDATAATGTQILSVPGTIQLGYSQPFTSGEALIYHAVPGKRVGFIVDGKDQDLIDGQTYYAVVNPNFPNSLQLSTAAGGSALPLDLNPTFTSGNQTYTIAQINTNDNSFTFDPRFQYQFTLGQALVYHGALGTNVLGLVDGQTYYAVPSPADANTIQLAASADEATAVSNTAQQNAQAQTNLPTLTPQAGSAVQIADINLANNTLEFFNPAPAFTTGQALTYTAVAGQSINQVSGSTLTPLANGTYYAIVDPNNPNAVQLAATQQDANNHQPLQLSASPLLTNLALGTQALAIASVDPQTHSVTFDSTPNPSISTGDAFRYTAAFGNPVNGLTDGATYYTIVSSQGSTTTYQLADSAADAASGKSIAFTPVLAGTNVKLAIQRSDAQAHTITLLAPQLLGTAQTVGIQQIDPDAHTLTLQSPLANSAATGTPFVYQAADGISIAGLQDGQTYYIIRQDGPPLTFTPSATNVNSSSNTISFDTETGFANGAAVVYHTNGGHAITGLQDGKTYYVINIDPQTIQLISAPLVSLDADLATGTQNFTLQGPTLGVPLNFDAKTGVSATNNTITFAAPHGLATGEPITYHASGTPLAGLVDGKTYYTVVVSDTAIQLAATQDDALAAGPTVLPLTADAVSSTQTFTPGGTISFTPPNVDSTSGTILFGFAHGLTTGQAVVYHANGGTPVTGLVDGKTYYVSAVTSTNIQLSETPALALNAAGATGVQSFTGNADRVIQLASSAANAQNHEALTTLGALTLTVPAGTALTYKDVSGMISGLISGTTYYLVPTTDPLTIQLAATLQDAISIPPAILGLGGAINLLAIDPTVMSGTTHSLTAFNTAGINITATLNSQDSGKTKSGTGSEPTLKDILTKGELSGLFTTEFRNLFSNVAGGQSNPVCQLLRQDITADDNKNPVNVTFGGSFLFQIVHNNVTAKAGSTAVLKSGQDVQVQATVQEKVQTATEATVAKPANGDDTALAAAVAVDVGIYSSNATATIDSGAVVDASGVLTVHSNVTYPFIFPFRDPSSFNPSTFFGSNPINNLIVPFLDGRLGLQSFLVNGWARSVVKAGAGEPKNKVGLAASIQVASYDDTSKATIGDGAKINQDSAYQADTQNVTVNAENFVDLINLAGIIDLGLSPDGVVKGIRNNEVINNLILPLGGGASKVGLGISVPLVFINHTTVAEIQAGTSQAPTLVHTGSQGGLTVNAHERVFTFVWGQTGGKSGGFGFSGTGSSVHVFGYTLAQLDGGIHVTGLGPVNVTALDDTNLITIGGSIEKGNRVGFGLTVVANTLNRQTYAIIGDRTDSPDKPTPPTHSSFFDLRDSLLPAGLLNINAANTGNSITLSFAAGVSSSSPPSSPQPLSTSDLEDSDDEFPDSGDTGVGSQAQGKYGVGISGDVSLNLIEADHAQAYINDLGTFYTGTVTLAADNTTKFVGLAGSVALARGTEGTKVGLAGSYSQATLTNTTTEAYITGPTLLNAQSLSLSATRGGFIFALTAGAAIATGDSGIGVAGSVSVNKITGTTQTGLNSTHAALLGDVQLKSHEYDQMWTIAGAVGYGGKIGGGAAAAVNEVGVTTQAQVTNSTITQSGDLTLSAVSDNYGSADERIISFAGSVGAATNAAGVAGTVAFNRIKNTTQAFVSSTTDNQNPLGQATITARDDSGIVSIAGAVGFAIKGNVGLGAAVAYNKIENTVAAYLDAASLATTGNLTLSATSSAHIVTVAIGAAGSQRVALAGSVAYNVIDNTVSASILGKSTTTSDGDVSLTASDTSTITTAAGGLAIAVFAKNGGGSTLSVGFAVGISKMTNTISATVDNSSVTGGSVTVTATSTPTISTYTFGGSGAATVSQGGGLDGTGAGAGSRNSISNTSTASIADSSTVDSAGDISLSATDSPTITADAGGFSLALLLGGAQGGAAISVGLSVAVNVITDTTTSSIDKSRASGKNVKGSATSKGKINALTLGATIGAGIGRQGRGLALTGAGAGSGNTIQNTVSATISNCSGTNSVQASGGDVALTAEDTSTITADGGGVAIAIAAGGQKSGADLSVGISAAINDIQNIIATGIDNSSVSGTGVSLATTSTPTIHALTIGGAGAGAGSSQGLGLAASGAGAGSGNTIKNTVSASVSGSSSITATGAFAVSAGDTSSIKADAGGVGISIAAGGQKGGAALSVGIAVASNDVGNTLTASVDSSTVSAASVALGSASSDTIKALTIGGALAGGGSQGMGLAGTGAGAGSGNTIENTVTATITNCDGTKHVTATSGAFDVSAADTSSVTADAGGFAIDVAVGGQRGGAALSVGISVATNDVGNTIEAGIVNSTASGGSMSLSAISNATVAARTLGGSASGGGSSQGLGLGGSGAGAGSKNKIHNTVTGSITVSSITSTGDVLINAADTSSVTADAGGFSIAIGASGQVTGIALSVGVSVAINDIGNTITSSADNSTVSAASVTLGATSQATIKALTIAGALAGAGSSQGLGIGLSGAGAGSGNTIHNTITADISNSTNITASSGVVALTAQDTSSITADGGGFAVAVAISAGGGPAAAVSVGASAANNEVRNKIQAYLDNAVVTGVSVALKASSNNTIKALTIGGALDVAASNEFAGLAVSLAGSGSGNTIKNTVEAYVTGGTARKVQATNGGVSISAQDSSDITGDAGGVALSGAGGASGGVGVSVGLAIVSNDMESTIQAYTDDAKVVATGAITVSASSTGTIRGYTFGASAAVSGGSDPEASVSVAAAGTGAESTSTIDNKILSYIQNGSDISGSSVQVSATDTATIDTRAGGGSLALSFSLVGITLGLDVVLATNTVSNTVQAYIGTPNSTTDETQVTATAGTVDVSASSNPDLTALSIAVTISGASGVAAGGGGGNASNTTSQTIGASIQGGSTVSASGNVAVSATNTPTFTATTGTGTLSFAIVGASVGASLATNTAGDTVQAYITHAKVTSTGGGVSIDASTTPNITKTLAVATTISISIGAGGSGANATADVKGTTEAEVGAGASIAAAGAVQVQSISTATTDAEAAGGGLSLLEISVMLANATIEGQILAHISGGASVTAASVSVQAASTNSSTSKNVVAGVGGVSGDGGKATSTDSSSTSAYIGQQEGVPPDGTLTTITAPTGTVQVQATTTTSTNDAQANGGDGGLVNIAALLATSTVSGTTEAYVGSGASVTASELDVLASATDTATSSILVAQVSVGGGDGANSSTTDSRNVAAFVGQPAAATTAGSQTTITVQGVVSIQANSTTTVTAGAKGGTGGLINVGALVASGTSSGSTTAYIGQGVNLSAGSVQVQANAALRNVTVSTYVISIGLGAGGAGTNTTATVNGTVAAFVGTQAGSTAVGTAPALNVAGNTTVAAASVSTTTVTTTVGSGGVLASASGQHSESTIAASTLAYLGDGTQISQTADLTITATATDQASNSATVGSGGILSGRGTKAVSTVTPTISAYMGNNVAVQATGNVDIEATSVRAEAHATGNAYGGGGIDVGIPQSSVTTGPTVSGYIGSQSTVTASGNVTVQAAALSTANSNNQTLDDYIHSDDPSTDTIYFEQHGQQTGNEVEYVAGTTPLQTPGGPLAISGSSRNVKVLVVDPNNLKFGAQFDAGATDASDPLGGDGVDAVRDEVRFAAPHDLLSGDAVLYNPNSNDPNDNNPSISPELNTTTPVYIRKIDDSTIKLTKTQAEALAPLTNFSSSQISGGDTFHVSGFQNGDEVTYRAPATVFFLNTYVDIKLDSNGAPVTDSDGNVVHDPGADNIYLGDLSTTTVDLQTGDQILYRTPSGVTPISPLISGHYYYVIRQAHDFQLAATQSDAQNGTAISLTPSNDPAVSNARIFLIPSGIGGLVNGKTYTVANSSGSTFQLVDPATGNLVTGLDTSLSSSADTQQIGKEGGIKLQAASGTQDFHIALTNTVTAADLNKLLGPGGVSLRTTNPPSGDGQAFASASGGSGGFLEFAFPEADVTVSPSVTAYVGAKSLQAGGDVTITAATNTNSGADSSNNAGGFVQVGTSGATTYFHNNDQAYVGNQDGQGNIDGSGVSISAKGNFTLSSTTALTTNVHAHSDGGGFVAVVHANATAEANNQTSTVVGSNAVISANTANVLADVTGLSLVETPHASAGGLFGSATANANSNASSNASVLLGSGIHLTGLAGVDVRALNENIDPQPDPDAHFHGIGPSHNHSNYADGNGNGGSIQLSTSVQADSGGTVFAGPRAAGTPLATVSGSSNLALYAEASDPGSTNGNINHSEPITWDANVTMAGGPNPYLLVDANGDIVQAVNVSVNDNGVTKTSGHINSSTIDVNNITNVGGGQAWFQGDTSVANSFQYPLFSFTSAFTQVVILNESSKDLKINQINVVNQGAGGSVVIQSPNGQQPHSPFNFNIATGDAGPTLIDIEHTDPSNLGNAKILLNDLIENPIGQTIIKNVAGDILSSSSAAIVRTNTANLQASGSIGADAGTRVPVQLVQSLVRGTSTLRKTNLIATATTGNVYLDLTGRRRDGGSDPFIIYVDAISAGGDIDVLLESSLVDPGMSGNTGGITVTLLEQGFTGTYYQHFSPDTGNSGPPLDPAVFANLANSTPTGSTYSFQHRNPNGSGTGTPGLSAGGNIIVNAVHALSTDPRLAIVGFINLLGNGYLDTTTNDSITLTEYSGALTVKTAHSTASDVTLTVPDLPATGQDLLVLTNGLINAANKVLLQVGDNATTETGSLLTAGTSVTLLGDYGNADPGVGTIININGSLSSPLEEIDGNDDNDTFNLNFVNGINAGLTTALLIVDGKSGTDNHLKVDDSADTVGNTGAMTASTITGLGMGGSGIQYQNIQQLEIDLGQGNDTFTVQSTNSTTTTTIYGDDGNDAVLVQSTAGALTINGGLGSDTVSVGDTEAGNNGNLDKIQGQVNVIGGGGSDQLFVNDHGAVGNYNYIVTPNSIINDPATIPSVPTPITPPTRTFAGVYYDNTGDTSLDTVTYMRLDGTDQPNQFTVSPSQITVYTINGNLPPYGTCNGDYLKLDTSHLAGGTGHRKLHITSPGNGYWDFTDGVHVYAQTVYFLSIEQFNHVAVIVDSVDAGRNALPVVKVRDAETGDLKFVLYAYETTFRGGVRVTASDVDCDGIPDLIVAPGPGRAPEVRIFSGTPDASGNYPHSLLTSFDAYSPAFTGGVYVALADVNGDGPKELITGPDAGWLPEVRVFDGKSLLTTHVFTGFQAFETTFRGGVRVAAGDLNNDGYAEIVASRGPGSATQLNVFNGRSYAGVVPNNGVFTPQLVRTIYPFSAGFHGGAYVAVGDFNGDGIRDISVGAGAGWLPEVVVISGVNMFTGVPLQGLSTFMANTNTFRGGVRVAMHPDNGGNSAFGVVELDALFMSFGAGNPPRNILRGSYTGVGLAPQLVDWVFEDPEFADGIFVG